MDYLSSGTLLDAMALMARQGDGAYRRVELITGQRRWP
jgi:hypothetical protein